MLGMSRRTRSSRTARRTLLIVGEGRHEEAFLNHVKHLYAPRGCGLAVTIKNARGKGAKHVIEWTIRQTRTVSYERVAAMLDTDTDWESSVAHRAREYNVRVLKSEPCFEALLLRVLGQSPASNEATILKPILRRHLTAEPTIRRAYESSFDRSVLEGAQHREQTIGALLRLFE